MNIELEKKKNLLYISNQARQEDDKDKTELLYTYPDLTLDDRMRQILRPYRYLGERKFEYYKLSLLPELPDILYSEPSLVTTGKQEHERVCQVVGQIMSLFGISGKGEVKYKIIYTCDTWNYLEDIYGPDNIKKAKEYLNLTREDQEQVRKIWLAPGLNKKLEIARQGNWTTIYEVLEDQVKDNLLFFGDFDRLGEKSDLPEFKKPGIIGKELPNLRDMIYSEFKLGEIIMMGDEIQGIKDRLAKIYKECEIDKTPKLKDLDEFFVMASCWVKGERGYRIDFRK